MLLVFGTNWQSENFRNIQPQYGLKIFRHNWKHKTFVQISICKVVYNSEISGDLLVDRTSLVNYTRCLTSSAWWRTWNITHSRNSPYSSLRWSWPGKKFHQVHINKIASLLNSPSSSRSPGSTSTTTTSSSIIPSIIISTFRHIFTEERFKTEWLKRKWECCDDSQGQQFIWTF